MIVARLVLIIKTQLVFKTYMFGLADVAPVKRSVPDFPSDIGWCPVSCIRQWSMMWVICQLDFTIPTIAKADGRDTGSDSSKSRALTNAGSRYCHSCLPRQTFILVSKNGLKQSTERTNKRFGYRSNCIYFLCPYA